MSTRAIALTLAITVGSTLGQVTMINLGNPLKGDKAVSVTQSATVPPSATIIKIPDLGLKVGQDDDGCYDIKDGAKGQVALALCQDEKAATQAVLTKDNIKYAWVNGTVTNTGTQAICQLTFSSADAHLSTDALLTVPAKLPVTQPGKLGAGEKIDFAFLLPIDAATGSAPFVGLGENLAPCTLVEQLQKGGDAAAEEAPKADDAAAAAAAEEAPKADDAAAAIEPAPKAADPAAAVPAKPAPKDKEEEDAAKVSSTSPANIVSYSLATLLVCGLIQFFA